MRCRSDFPSFFYVRNRGFCTAQTLAQFPQNRRRYPVCGAHSTVTATSSPPALIPIPRDRTCFASRQRRFHLPLQGFHSHLRVAHAVAT